ncbi:PorP/SprF family type IX secretion system membrane protein [Pontibacter sp. H249]|uniref:PorP/SprF family type IX secretion system membrane protein n=1 Tax=Pontibacter sp. H249 TaxID=3133420 RepID=UPI0030BE5703
MNRIILVASCLVALCLGAQAQSQKQMVNFSQFQQYFNPSLTGFEGSALKTLYRNQWTGFEDAPKTILATAELDINSVGVEKGYRYKKNGNNYLNGISAKQALGLTVLHDQFGPSKETQLFLSYGSGIRLSETLSLRWGTALTYHSQRLDGNSLTVDQQNDPRYANILGNTNRMSKADLNLGISVSSAKFYAGYAMQDITKGKLIRTGDDYLQDFYTQKHIVQAGYRTPVTEQLGLIFNGIYQYDTRQDNFLEGQLKAVYKSLLWAGVGYRNNTAYSFTGGVRVNQLRIHYAYETPIQDSRYISKPTNEIALTYSFFNLKSEGANKQILFW